MEKHRRTNKKNPGAISITPGFYPTLFTKNRILLTSFIVLFLYIFQKLLRFRVQLPFLLE